MGIGCWTLLALWAGTFLTEPALRRATPRATLPPAWVAAPHLAGLRSLGLRFRGEAETRVLVGDATPLTPPPDSMDWALLPTCEPGPAPRPVLAGPLPFPLVGTREILVIQVARQLLGLGSLWPWAKSPLPGP